MELSRNPQNIIEQCWYYEEPGGIEIIHELPERIGKPLRIKISWRKLIASVKRYQSFKARANTRVQATASPSARQKLKNRKARRA